MAARLAAGGLDFIKDDHGIADQAYSPFADRVCACAEAVRRGGSGTLYVPNISGSFDVARGQIALAIEEGVEAVMIPPMILGVSNFHRLAREFRSMAFFGHPAMAGASRIAPPLLFGKLFRLFGADAVIYPNYGGRFSYSPETSRAVADAARRDWHGLRRRLPVSGGRHDAGAVAEILDFYGPDTMLLIGGSLLSERDRLTEATAQFVKRVAGYFEDGKSDG